MGIYKRKQESKKERKQAFDQESDQEKTITAKKKERKHALDQEKKEKLSSFFLTFLFSSMNCHL